MSQREKRLVIATTIIVVIGLGAWLARGDGPSPAHAESSPDATPPSAPKPPPITAPPSSTGTSAPEPPARAYSYRIVELESLLAAREAPGWELTEDPFLPVPAASSTALHPFPPEAGDLPSIGGIFISSATRGVLLDGQVRFLGDMHGSFKVLVVEEPGVVLERGGKTYSVPYRPELRPRPR